MEVAGQPLRLGFSPECDLELEGSEGPPVLFEINRLPGPLEIATRVPPAELSNFVELAVDGTPLHESARTLEPGSRIDVVDKATKRRYSLVLDPLPPWMVRARFLAGTVVILATLGAIYGAYLFQQMRGAMTTLSHTERQVERHESELREARDLIESAEGRFAASIRALELERASSERVSRAAFEEQLESFGRRAREARARLSEEDSQAREALRREMSSELEALRAEFAGRMVESYQRLKVLEREVLDSVAARLDALEPDTDRFKRVLTLTRDAVIFIHTRYTVRFEHTGAEQQYDSFGTGFLASPDGLALTAQHVLFPWRYERELLVLVNVGAATVLESDTRWSIWPTGAQVLESSSDPEGRREDTGFHSDGDVRTVHFLHAPEPAVSTELVSVPVGVVEISVPQPGATDVAVIRLQGRDEAWSHLAAMREPTALEPLDDLLVIGYPFSRLQDGVAIPQAVRGFVRRVSAELIEVDMPLHPGVSGAPIVDGGGRLVGMASAIYQSPLYGIATPHESLLAALDAVRGDGQR